MAKGKTPLKDTVPDSEIVKSDEVTNKPDWVFPDGEYGISGKYKDYSLVCKKVAYKTGKEEDGINNGKVIEYIKWEDCPSYQPTIVGIFQSYAKILNLSEFKTRKMNDSIADLVAIHKNTQDKIMEALKGYDTYLTQTQEETCNLIDMNLVLEQKIQSLEDRLEHYMKLDKEIDDMYKTIKEKTTIIVNRDKPRNHKTKLEKE